MEWRRWFTGAICYKPIPFPSIPVKHECSNHVETCTTVKKQEASLFSYLFSIYVQLHVQPPVQLEPCSATCGMYLQQLFCSRHGVCRWGKTNVRLYIDPDSQSSKRNHISACLNSQKPMQRDGQTTYACTCVYGTAS